MTNSPPPAEVEEEWKTYECGHRVLITDNSWDHRLCSTCVLNDRPTLKVFHVVLQPAKTPTDTPADLGCEIVCLGENREWLIDELIRGRKGLPRTKETLDRIQVTEITGPFVNGFVLAFREGITNG